MLNTNRVKNKVVNKKNIIIFFSLIIIITLTTVFVFNNRTGNNNIKKNVGTRNKNNKKIAINKRKGQVSKKNAQILPGGEVAPWNIKRTDGRKMAYLTFDDGQSINTTGILQVLDKNNIKANFFITG
ncbi:polysaccharide deacetylase family protein [Clostridium akagii]|uniref:polysaccharide deacetylase family protein n=1 Tax=Clostridium akagii TaxID=91623 RepID=UPI00047D330C|nr:polysaccharide deacetylase family protein [Clostridium akagii]